jgi:Fe-Mn family superoxide dismutase
MSQNYYEFDLISLPYEYDALEPYISGETMRVHHERLLKGYVERLNLSLENRPRLQKLALEEMLEHACSLPACVKNRIVRNGGGVYNHNFFFSSLRPGADENRPVGPLASEIDRAFGSFSKFKGVFKENAMSVFGSGYVWLVKDSGGCLCVVQTRDQDTPLASGYSPLLNIDVWEHAYFLDCLDQRAEYIDRWFHVVNWDRAAELFLMQA